VPFKYARRQVTVEWVSWLKLVTVDCRDARELNPPLGVSGSRHSLRDGPAMIAPPAAAGDEGAVVVVVVGEEVVVDVEVDVVVVVADPPPPPATTGATVVVVAL